MIGKRFVVIAAALAVTLVVAPGASAMGSRGAGARGSGSSLSVVLMDSTDGLAHFGQNVTFKLSTTATTQPFVRLNCYQGGAWVYTSSVGYFAGYPWDQYFTLESGNWTSGAGDCTATLYSVNSKTGKETDLVSVSFRVYA